MIPSRFDAIVALVGGGVSIGGSDSGNVTYHDGQTPPTEEEIEAKLSEIQDEYNAQAYARNRKLEYDALNQLEMQYDDEVNSTTTWKNAIEAIKTKYPKG